MSLWSDNVNTWQGFPPGDGDFVQIPKGLHLLYDLESSPVYSVVNVEGSLIIAPAPAGSVRTFDAHQIITLDGYIEIGTETEPYLGDFTFTMHGLPTDPKLPIFGSKCIAVKGTGQIEMHGAPKVYTWVELEETADVGETSIKIHDLPSDLDWSIGDKIVIASTDFEGRHAEERTITNIRGTSTNRIIDFND